MPEGSLPLILDRTHRYSRRMQPGQTAIAAQQATWRLAPATIGICRPLLKATRRDRYNEHATESHGTLVHAGQGIDGLGVQFRRCIARWPLSFFSVTIAEEDRTGQKEDKAPDNDVDGKAWR
jgi:hypothetical protein